MTEYRKRFTIGCTVVDVVPYDNNVTSRCDHKIFVTGTVQVLYDNNLSCCNQKKIVVTQENPNCSNLTVPTSQPTAPTGDMKKITKKVHKGGGSEGIVDFRNANKCNVLFVVHKGIEIKGVVGFKIANNQNGLACSDSNLY